MPKQSSIAVRLDQAGPFFLGALALTGVFARGGANISYALLGLWGLILWGRAVLDRGSPRPPLPPARCVAALAAFTLIWLAAILAGDDPAAGLKIMAGRLLPLGLPLLAWPAFSRRPDLLSRLPFLWGLGLIVAAGLTFREGGYQLICLRAKAHLGIINLGSTLGQLIPVMVAAFLMALSSGRRRETAFFALALVAASLALTQNCSRQTLLAAPALSLLVFWVYRRNFRKPQQLLLALALALVFILPLASGGGLRFLKTLEYRAGSDYLILNEADRTIRLGLWSQGWDAFQDHPWLGQGLGKGFWLTPLPPEGAKGPPPHSHQMFIDVLAKTGLLGFAGFLALHLAPLSLLWPHRRSRDPETFFWVWAALAVNLQFVLNGLTDQVFGLKTMMYVHWTVTAAALWQTQKAGRSDS